MQVKHGPFCCSADSKICPGHACSPEQPSGLPSSPWASDRLCGSIVSRCLANRQSDSYQGAMYSRICFVDLVHDSSNVPKDTNLSYRTGSRAILYPNARCLSPPGQIMTGIQNNIKASRTLASLHLSVLTHPPLIATLGSWKGAVLQLQYSKPYETPCCFTMLFTSFPMAIMQPEASRSSQRVC